MPHFENVITLADTSSSLRVTFVQSPLYEPEEEMRSKAARIASRLTVALLAASCGGNQGGGTSSSGDGSSKLAGTTGATETGDVTGASTCIQPDGPLHPYSTAAELETLIVGNWARCSGPELFNHEAIGLQILGSGTYYFLVNDASGGIRRESGLARQGTWDDYQETPSSVQVDFHPSPNSGDGGYALFEDNPRRYQIEYDEQPPTIYSIIE